MNSSETTFSVASIWIKLNAKKVKPFSLEEIIKI
jgi:hypothetical protein